MIIVAGVPRCGTSMMMRCLSICGVHMAFNEAQRDDKMKEEFRNIYGFFEGSWDRKDGAIKQLGGVSLERFPNPRVILMTRSKDRILNSWRDIRSKGQNPEQTIELFLANREALLDEKILKVQESVKNYPHIEVNYDTFVSNPEVYREQFNTIFPELNFDTLITGIDENLYIDRTLEVFNQPLNKLNNLSTTDLLAKKKQEVESVSMMVTGLVNQLESLVRELEVMKEQVVITKDETNA